MSEHIEIAHCDHYLGFSLEPALLFPGHVGDPIDIFNKYIRPAYAFPRIFTAERPTCIAIGIF